MKIIVTGATGLVGRALVAHCSGHGDEVLGYDRQSLDISDPVAVESTVMDQRPDAVINCAAWTDVDACESNAAKARQANGDGPENLARAARQSNAVLITISTDYVFDGEKKGFYTQLDQPRPLSVYGRAKLEGELRAQQAYERTIVVRSGYIFGPGGKNFLSAVVRLAQRGEQLKAISDYWGTPTYVRDLTARLRELAQLDLPGIYHVVSAGEGASFETFTREALKLASLDAKLVEAVEGAKLHRPAARPRNSRLKCLRSEAIGLAPLPDWREGLADFVSGLTQGARRAQIP